MDPVLIVTINRGSLGTEVFESSTFSLILSWLFSLLLIFSILITLLNYFLADSEFPKIFLVWVLICIIIFSPARYIILQMILATAYPFQSIYSFFQSLWMIIFVPFVFAILYFFTLYVPLLITMWISAFRKKVTKARLIVAGIVAPVLFIVFSFGFYYGLPVAGNFVHGANPQDVIKSTNGPAAVYFDYFIEDLNPLSFRKYIYEIGLNNLSSKELLRAHVAAIYLDEQGYNYYAKRAHPEAFKTIRLDNSN